MGHRFILAAAICLLAAGCGRPDNSDPIPKSPLRGKPKPTSIYVCDTPAEQQTVEAHKTFEESVTLLSTYNNVEKIDCDGKLTETTVEEVGFPRVLVWVPAPEIADADKVLGVKITNLRTCKSLTIDATKNETRTSLDIYIPLPNGDQIPVSPAPLLAKDLSVKFVGEIFFMQVGTVVPLSAGVNVVAVEYQDCANCEAPKTLYTTSLKLNVKHEVAPGARKTVRRSTCRAAN